VKEGTGSFVSISAAFGPVGQSIWGIRAGKYKYQVISITGFMGEVERPCLLDEDALRYATSGSLGGNVVCDMG
jgi:hypothetical protein